MKIDASTLEETNVISLRTRMESPFEKSDLVVFSHLRWDFVFQRPQHLMSRFARYRRVYFFEEPIYGQTAVPRLHIKEGSGGVRVVVPHLPGSWNSPDQDKMLTRLVDELVEDESLRNYTFWYYTPMSLPFSRHLNPIAVIYDCMDELSHFKGAPPEMLQNEQDLFRLADVVFTGGHSLYEAKRHQHHNIYPFPSSIDFEHFSKARGRVDEPADQKSIPHPRLGFFGVIDERMDLSMIEGIAKLRPDWHLVMIGPVVKIDPASLPHLPNIHYLGKKEYAELPRYIAGWDVALMPFALNESTRFISPTKTPEYLAAGRPVVSTAIRDVVCPYGREKLVSIASSPEEFVEMSEVAMRECHPRSEWMKRVDEFLSDKSWESTWREMAAHESTIYKRRENSRPVMRWNDETLVENV